MDRATAQRIAEHITRHLDTSAWIECWERFMGDDGIYHVVFAVMPGRSNRLTSINDWRMSELYQGAMSRYAGQR